MSAPVELELRLRQAHVPVNPAPYQLDALLRLRAAPGAGRGAPMALVLAVDSSGSMEAEGKLERVKDAALRIAGALGSGDRLAIVGFADAAEVHAPLGGAGWFSGTRWAIRRLAAGGGTRVSAGLEAALKELDSADPPVHPARMQESKGEVRGVLLLTDGNTSGDEKRALELAAKLRDRGAAFRCVGVGSDWNSGFLQELSSGDYDYLERADQIPALFDKLCRRLQGVVARGVEVAVEPVASARLENVLRCKRDAATGAGEDVVRPLGRGPRLAVGDVVAGEEEDLLVPLVFTPARAGDYRVATVRVTGQSASGAAFEVVRDVEVEATADRTVFEQVDPEVTALLARVHVKRAQHEALADLASADPVRRARGTNRLRGTTRRLEEMGEHELASLTRRVVEQAEGGAADGRDAKALRQITKRL